MKTVKVFLILTAAVSIAAICSAAILPYFIHTAYFQSSMEVIAGLIVFMICSPAAFILAFIYRKYINYRLNFWMIFGCLLFPFVFPIILAAKRPVGFSSKPADRGLRCIRCGKPLSQPPDHWVGTGAALADRGLKMPYNCPSCGVPYCLDCMTMLRKTLGGVCPKCGMSVK